MFFTVHRPARALPSRKTVNIMPWVTKRQSGLDFSEDTWRKWRNDRCPALGREVKATAGSGRTHLYDAADIAAIKAAMMVPADVFTDADGTVWVWAQAAGRYGTKPTVLMKWHWEGRFPGLDHVPQPCVRYVCGESKRPHERLYFRLEDLRAIDAARHRGVRQEGRMTASEVAEEFGGEIKWGSTLLYYYTQNAHPVLGRTLDVEESTGMRAGPPVKLYLADDFKRIRRAESELSVEWMARWKAWDRYKLRVPRPRDGDTSVPLLGDRVKTKRGPGVDTRGRWKQSMILVRTEDVVRIAAARSRRRGDVGVVHDEDGTWVIERNLSAPPPLGHGWSHGKIRTAWLNGWVRRKEVPMNLPKNGRRKSRRPGRVYVYHEGDAFAYGRLSPAERGENGQWKQRERIEDQSVTNGANHLHVIRKQVDETHAHVTNLLPRIDARTKKIRRDGKAVLAIAVKLAAPEAEPTDQLFPRAAGRHQLSPGDQVQRLALKDRDPTRKLQIAKSVRAWAVRVGLKLEPIKKGRQEWVFEDEFVHVAALWRQIRGRDDDQRTLEKLRDFKRFGQCNKCHAPFFFTGDGVACPSCRSTDVTVREVPQQRRQAVK